MKWVLYTGFLVALSQWTCTEASINPITIPAIVSCQPAQKMYEITLAHPQLKFAWSPDTILNRSNVINIQIKEVDNPAKVPVTLNVKLSNGDKNWSVGNFTLYPSDKPGEFRLRINNVEEIRKKVHASKEKTFRVEIDLDTKPIKQNTNDKLMIKISEPVFDKA